MFWFTLSFNAYTSSHWRTIKCEGINAFCLVHTFASSNYTRANRLITKDMIHLSFITIRQRQNKSRLCLQGSFFYVLVLTQKLDKFSQNLGLFALNELKSIRTLISEPIILHYCKYDWMLEYDLSFDWSPM